VGHKEFGSQTLPAANSWNEKIKTKKPEQLAPSFLLLNIKVQGQGDIRGHLHLPSTFVCVCGTGVELKAGDHKTSAN
jgi:hypothetical protein